jgi:conjugative relaxase-like TrwC/TraI family protein
MVRGTDKFTTGKGYLERHLCHNDYYEQGRTIEGHWVGKACESYGVEAGSVVSEEAFKALAGNQNAVTGERLTMHKQERKPFCDMTTGCPKTFSIAAVVGKSEVVRGWHRQATEKMLREMERITGRQAHNGRDHVELTGNFCAALYEHNSNRCLEPHLHTHAIIFNATRDANGKDYAVEFRQYMDQCRYLTEVYNDELAAQALAHGVELVKDQHGAPQIKALLEFKEIYQERTKQIEALIEKVEEIAGTRLTNREAKVIAVSSRGLDLERFRSMWEENRPLLQGLKRLDPEGAEAARREILVNFTKMVTKASNNRLERTNGQEVEASQQSLLSHEQRTRVFEFSAGLDQRVARQAPSRSIDRELDFCVEHLFERQSVINGHDLYETLLNTAQGKGVDLEAMRAAVAAHRSLVSARGEVTTTAHLKREVESVLWVEEGKGAGVVFSAQGISEKLNEHQRQAITSLLECPDQFTALSAPAGTGKTYGLFTLIERNLSDHRCKRVAVVAPSDKARDKVREQAAELPEGSQVGQALADAVSLQMFQTDPRLHKGFRKGDLLIVDEASFASVEQGHWVEQWARERGCRVLFSGDAKQLTSVEAGDHFRILLGGSGIHTASLDEQAIIRQKENALDGRYLQAVKLFTQGKSTEAFRELSLAGRIVEKQGNARVEAFADAIIRSREEGITAIACNPTHRENDAINDAVRNRLAERGELRDERTLQANRSLGWTVAQKREVNKIEAGQVLEIVRGADKGRTWTVTGVQRGKVTAVDATGERRLFTRAHAGLFDLCERRELKVAAGDTLLTRSGTRSERGDVVNGEVLRVTGWDEAGNPVAADGRSIVGRNLTHGYASTSYRVQGDTASRVLLGFDRHSIRWASQKIAYVMASRGRIDLQLFVENTADLSQIQSRKGDRKAAVEMELAPSLDDQRPEVKLFRKLQQLRSCSKEEPDHKQTVDLCRAAAEALEPKREQVRSNCQARTIEPPDLHAIRAQEEVTHREERTRHRGQEREGMSLGL